LPPNRVSPLCGRSYDACSDNPAAGGHQHQSWSTACACIASPRSPTERQQGIFCLPYMPPTKLQVSSARATSPYRHTQVAFHLHFKLAPLAIVETYLTGSTFCRGSRLEAATSDGAPSSNNGASPIAEVCFCPMLHLTCAIVTHKLCIVTWLVGFAAES